jgi:hemoglobin-like flavoprotein
MAAHRRGMPITSRQVDLVCDSAAAVDDILEDFAAAFYTRLFRVRPDFKPMFSADPTVQASKLAMELRRIVSALRDPVRFQRQVRTLGARHGRYGVEAEHYDATGHVLLDAFEQELGAAFTPELHDAWAAAWGTIAAVMLEASAAATAAASASDTADLAEAV